MFRKTPLHKIKVVIIGQDPYPNYQMHDETKVPDAMGLSFSVPNTSNIPSSLDNIYKNCIKYKHMYKYPPHGNLSFWAYQCVFLLNTALSVQENCKLSHACIWEVFTNEVIKYISNNCDHVAFILWGSHALSKKSLIDDTKHFTSISSHPSGMSCHKPLNKYPSFVDCDHFGTVNKILDKWKINNIVWYIT